MSIFDLFRSQKLPPGDPQTQRYGVKLINKNAEPQTRMDAADALFQIGSDEAIYCLLQRYTVLIGTYIPDDDEKNYITDRLITIGAKAVPSIMKFLKEKEHPAMAIRLLKKLTKPEQFIDLILELCSTFDPYYSKYPDKKIQTFRALSEFKDNRIIPALAPFLDDDDDDIRIAAIHAISKQEDEENSRELLIQTIIESGERPRVRLAACETMALMKWRVTGYRKQAETALPAQFYMDGKGHIISKPDYNPMISNEN